MEHIEPDVLCRAALQEPFAGTVNSSESTWTLGTQPEADAFRCIACHRGMC